MKTSASGKVGSLVWSVDLGAVNRPTIAVTTITDDTTHMALAIGWGTGATTPVWSVWVPVRLPRWLVEWAWRRDARAFQRAVRVPVHTPGDRTLTIRGEYHDG